MTPAGAGRRRALALCLGALMSILAGPAWGPARLTAAVLPQQFTQAPVAAGAGSLAPVLSAREGGPLVLSWLEPDPPARSAGKGTPAGGNAGEARSHSLRFSLWRDGAWTPPLTVLRDDSLFVNWADVPSVVPEGGDTLVAHWLRRTAGGTYDYGVRLARSTDLGRTWSAPMTPHHDGLMGEHGFVSLVDWPEGGLAALWLDGRAMTAHGEDPTQSMTLRHAVLEPSGETSGETLLDARTCECCPTDAARTRDAVVVVYRDRSERELRDIHSVRWQGGEWSDPQRVAADGWKIAGCPVNGPAVSARADDVVVAWFTAPEDSARVLLARSSDGGRSFSPPVRVDQGSPVGRADVILLGDGSAAVCWIEEIPAATRTGSKPAAGAGSSARPAAIRVRRVAPDGRLGAPVTVTATTTARRAGIPRLASAGAWLVCAWTDPAEPTRIRSASIGADHLPR